MWQVYLINPEFDNLADWIILVTEKFIDHPRIISATIKLKIENWEKFNSFFTTIFWKRGEAINL